MSWIKELHRLRESHDRLLAAARAAMLDGSLASLPDVHIRAFGAAIVNAEKLITCQLGMLRG